MKAKLLLAASLFAVIANAQVSTINEDFNSFTAGSTTFPQKGWSAILAANPLPFPPAPLMIVTSDADKLVQAYSGNNSSLPSYLITPQIVTPAGDKTLTFITSLAATSPGVGTIQVGVASNPADMSTFIAIGEPVQVTTNNFQNVSIDIPASTGSYLVFKITPTAAHTAIQIDNVVYDTKLAVAENAFSSTDIKFAISADNSSLKFVSSSILSQAKVYSASGQLSAEGKIINNTFDITKLKTGVYFIIIENTNGQSVKSKFIKK